jgi:hypothetical protein
MTEAAELTYDVKVWLRLVLAVPSCPAPQCADKEDFHLARYRWWSLPFGWKVEIWCVSTDGVPI